ncbi:hypothetical protein BOX15_Mlig017692g1, partial [Macrostomum lignano]
SENLSAARSALHQLLRWSTGEQADAGSCSSGGGSSHSQLDLAVAAKTEAFLAEASARAGTISPSAWTAAVAEAAAEPLLYWRYLRAVAAGIDWLAEAAQEPGNVDKVAIGDVSLAQAGLEFLAGLGIRPCLAPGVGPPLSDRLASGPAGADLLRVRPPSDASERRRRLAWLTETLGRWTEGDGAVAVAAGRFLADRLAVLLQLSFGPEAAAPDGLAERTAARRRLHGLLSRLPCATAMRELLCLHRRAGLPDSAAKWLVRAASHLLSEQLLQRPDGVLGLLGAVFDDAAAAGAGDSRHSVSEKVTSVTGLLSACPAKFSDSLAKQLFQVYRRLGPADKRLQSACCHVIVCWCGGANSLAAATLDQLLRDCVLADFSCLAARRPATAAANADASKLAVSNDDVTTSSKPVDSKDDVITSSKPDDSIDGVITSSKSADSKNDVTTSLKSVDSKDDVISPKRHAASNNDVIDSAEPIDPEDDVIRSSCPAGSAPEDAVNLAEPLSRLSILLSCVKQTDSDFLRRLAGLIDPLFYLLVAATAELQQRKQQPQKQQQCDGGLSQLCDRLTACLSVFPAVYPFELGTGLLHRLLSEPVNGGHLPSVEFSLPDSILVRPRHVQLPDVGDPALRLTAADVVLALLDSTSDSSGRPGLSGRLFGRLLKDLSDSFSTNGGCMGLGQLSALVRLCQEPRLAERVFSTAQPADLASLCQSLLRHTMLPSAASSAELDEQRRESLELALSIVSAVTLGLHSAGSNAEVAALTPTLLEAAGRADLPEATRQLARSLAVRTATLGRVSVGDDIDEACRTRPTAVSDLLLSGSALLDPGNEEKMEKEVEDEEGEAPAAYRAVFADIQSGEPPRMGAGILALTRQLRAGAPRGPRLADACARLLQMCADHPDSYVHLPAAEALAVLACQLPDRLLPLLAGLYGPGDGPGGAGGRRRSTELRLRIGESMVRCSRYLNELLPSQTSRIVGPLLLGARDPEPQLRASAVSCLAELCGRQRWWCLDRPSVGLQEILGCACSLLRSDPDPLPRRAAAHLLCQLVRACDRLSLAGLPAACLSELHRALRLAESVERDEAALVQVRLALEELDACVRDALFPAPSADRMQKRIWVLDAPGDSQ